MNFLYSSKLLNNFLIVLFIINFSCADRDGEKSKRQIFREQVLPHSGGKIPESAFRSDRLALNKLQKLGVAIPDGMSLETRYNNVLRLSHDPETEYTVVRILQEDEGRYVPPEGRSYPNYPKSIQSTYLIRPPIGSYRFGPHIYRAIPGPPLKLGGASIEATTGGNHGAAQYAPVRPEHTHHHAHAPQNYPTHAQLPLQYAYSHVHRLDPTITSSAIPTSTLNPEHAQYVAQGDIDASFPSNSEGDFMPSTGYNNFYSDFLSKYGGLLKVNTPFSYSNYNSFFNYPALNYPVNNGAYSLLESGDDLAFRLRRRVGTDEVSPAASETTSKTSEVPSFKCNIAGKEAGLIYSDPLSGCRKQYMCLNDGRAAAYICPDGTTFDHRARKCNIRKRRVKLDSNCNVV